MPKKNAYFFTSPRFITRMIAVSSILALSLATGLLFIAPQLSVMIFALAGIALFIGNHTEERRIWESRTEKRVSGLQAQQETLARDVHRNSARIERLKQAVRDVEATQARTPRTFDAFGASGQTAKHTKSDMQSDPAPTLSPLRAKAQNTPSTSAKAQATHSPSPSVSKPIPVQMVANDRPQEGKYNDTLSDIVVKELMHHALKESDIDMFTQPILRLPEGEEKFYEVYGRIKARKDSYLPASRFLRFAREDGLMRRFDLLVLMHCLNSIKDRARHDSKRSFFMNIEPRSLKDREFMNALLSFLAKNRTMAPQLILELPQGAFQNRDHRSAKILNGLKALGCSFSIDHVQNFDFDVMDLHNAQVRFVKVRAGMMIHALSDHRKRTQILRLKRQMESNGIGVIVERIENGKMLDALAPYAVKYGQGYLFGQPHLHTSMREAA